MRSERKKQIMTLSILLVAILVISIGFAAFSKTFQFEPTLTVNPDSRMFGVKFSKTSNEVTTGIVTPTPYPSQETLGLSKEIVADDITIDGSTTLEGLFATFISPGDSVEYSFYAVNAGEYDAYLNSINFIGNKTCTAGEGTTNDLVQAACNGISMEVTVDGVTYQNPSTQLGIKLIKKAHQTITVKLSYDTNAARADGPFTVEFQDLSLVYSTLRLKYTGEIYRNSTESLSIGGDINTVAYETSPLNINKTNYLKHDVVEDIVTASYACITYTENGTRKDVCLRGGSSSYYASNQTTLQSVESYFNTLPYGSSSTGYGYCNFDDSNSYCNSDSLYLDADSYGYVHANGVSSRCYVYSDGYSYCYG